MLRRCVLNTGAFEFESGGSLPGLELAYHCSGREYRKGEKVVWICHALTANSDPEDWWPQVVGPGKFIDPEKCFVVCVNMLCSPYGSSGPASTDPSSGRPYLMRFPKITIRDIVAGNILVRKHLGIDRVDVLIGPSIGGFQAYEWAVTEPEVFSRVIFLATTDRCTPYMTAFNESQRMALLSDPTFGEAASLSGGKAGPHGLMGIGANFIPKNMDVSLIDEIVCVREEDAYAAGRDMVACEGVLVGITAGAALWAATQLALRPENAGKTIVALLPDGGERYLSTPMYQGE